MSDMVVKDNKRKSDGDIIKESNDASKKQKPALMIGSVTGGNNGIFDTLIFELVMHHGEWTEASLARCCKSFWIKWNQMLERPLKKLLKEVKILPQKHSDVYDRITHVKYLTDPDFVNAIRDKVKEIDPDYKFKPKGYSNHDEYWVGTCRMCCSWPVWIGGNQSGWMEEVCSGCYTELHSPGNGNLWRDYRAYRNGSKGLNYHTLYSWMNRDRSDFLSSNNTKIISLLKRSGHLDEKTCSNLRLCNKRLLEHWFSI